MTIRTLILSFAALFLVSACGSNNASTPAANTAQAPKPGQPGYNANQPQGTPQGSWAWDPDNQEWVWTGTLPGVSGSGGGCTSNCSGSNGYYYYSSY